MKISVAGLWPIICLGAMTAVWGALADATPTKGALLPQKAMLVFTRESWGCLLGQEIKADVTALLIGDRAPGVRWEEIKNPEDRQDRLELYLYFPARPVSGLPGYLVLRLGSSNPNPLKPGSVLLKRAELTIGPNGPAFELKGQIQGSLTAGLLYAEDFDLHQGLFTCPEADLFEPQNIYFLKAYPLKPDLSVKPEKPSGRVESFAIPLDESRLGEAQAVAAGAELLTRLDQEFKVSGKFTFLWDKARITSQSLEGLASSWETGKGVRSNIALILRDRQGSLEIRRSPAPFTPQLRQKIAVQDRQGRIWGGEVWIGIDLPR